MFRRRLFVSAILIGLSALAGAAEAGLVKRNSLRPQDTAPSVEAIVADLSDGALTVDLIEGIHHPRTKGEENGQDNTAVIYARLSGRLELGGEPVVRLSQDILTFPCDQLEDDRWICSAGSLQSLTDPGAPVTDYFILEK
jgi:hypothetical protein